MPLLNLARNIIADKVTGGSSYTAFNNANARLGVGNSATAFSAAHTGLQGGSTDFAAMNPSFPARTANVVEYEATFATGDANFAWQEVTVDNGTETLSRHVESLGTKTSAASWVALLEQTWVLV